MLAENDRFAIHGTNYRVTRIELGPARGSPNGVLLRRQAMYWLAGEGHRFKVRVTRAAWGNPAFEPLIANVYSAEHYAGAFELLRRLVGLTEIRTNVEIREEFLPPVPPATHGGRLEVLWSPEGRRLAPLPAFEA